MGQKASASASRQPSGPTRGYAGYAKSTLPAQEADQPEPDVIHLQVLCLSGEGISLSVLPSMLGREVRRLILEKFPSKQGTKLALYHVNSRLMLDQTLQEQGMLGRTATLSCT